MTEISCLPFELLEELLKYAVHEDLVTRAVAPFVSRQCKLLFHLSLQFHHPTLPL